MRKGFIQYILLGLLGIAALVGASFYAMKPTENTQTPVQSKQIPLVGVSTPASPAFPTSLNNFQDGDIINSGDWNAIENTIGVTGSNVTSSLTYKLTNASSTSPGHKHSGSDIATGTVSVSNGGTATTSLTSNAVLIGNGTSSPKMVSPTTSPSLLGSVDGSSWSSFQLVGNNIIVSTSTSQLTLSASTKFGGTGADGALVATSSTTTIDLAGASMVVKNYSSISITGTGAVAFSNPSANGTIVIFRVSGNYVATTTANPAIDLRGIGANAGTAGVSNFFIKTGYGTNAANSSTIGVGGTAPAATGTPVLAHAIPLFVGAGSGNGSDAASTQSAGGGGGASAINNGTSGNSTVALGGTSGTPGSGSRGGGCIYIEIAGTFTSSSTINASGTNGGDATQFAGSAGGGGGGCIVILYNTLVSNTGTYTVSGGSPGATPDSSSDGGVGGAGYAIIQKNTEY